jgi:hypothetical protein
VTEREEKTSHPWQTQYPFSLLALSSSAAYFCNKKMSFF